MKLTQEQIDKAVNWWAARLQRPTFNTLGPNDNRNDPNNRPGALAEELATMMAKGQTDEAVEKFKTALRKHLESDVTIAWDGLHVDYGPDTFLSAVLKDAGMEDTGQVLPWKTDMCFEQGEVRAKCGYGEPYATL